MIPSFPTSGLPWRVVCGLVLGLVLGPGAVLADELDDLLDVRPAPAEAESASNGEPASGEGSPSEEEATAREEDDSDARGGTGEPAAGQEADEPGEPVAAPEPSTPEPSSAGPRRPSRVIEEVVVTAQKKEEVLQDVPISVTALDGEFLKEVGIDNIHELAEFTPNVRFTTNACCTTVFVRGFGTPFAAGAFDPTVGLALDELSITREMYMSDPLFDIERFEVLRGPQGTLFGKNTPAGLFNVVTAGPTDDYEGYLIGRIGGLGVHRVEAAVGGPLPLPAWNAGFRLAMVDSEQAGDVRNTALGVREPATEQQAARLKLTASPHPDLDVMLVGSKALTDSRFFHIQSDSFRDATVDFLRDYDPRFEDDPFNHQNSIDLRDDLNRDTELVQTNLRWTPPDLAWLRAPEVVAVLGWTGFDQEMGFDVDFSPAEVAYLARVPNNFLYDQKSIELRAGGALPGFFGFGELDVLVGGLLYEADLETANPLTGGEDLDEYLLSPAGFELATGQPPPGGVGFQTLAEAAAAFGVAPPPSGDSLEGDGALFFLDQVTRSQGIFGQVGWRFLEEWQLSLGGRVTFEQKEARILNECFEPGFLCGALGIEEFDADVDRSETDVSPKVTLQYFPLDELTLFATRAQGFKSGGYNNFSFTQDALEVDPEKTVSWEVGAKGKGLDGALGYGLTLFWMDVDDLQLQTTLGALVQVRNAASARSRGVELDFQWLTPWEPLSLRGSGAFTEGKFLDFPNAPPVAGSGQESQDLGGRRMPFVPKWQVNATPELRFPLPLADAVTAFVPSGLDLTFALDLLYRSNFFLDNDLDPHTLQDSYVTLDGRIGAATRDGVFDVALGVDNVTDADVLEFNVDSLLYPGGYVAFQEFQRTWTLQARYNW